jgi:hypothetical protein
MKLILYPKAALKASPAPFGTECESLKSFGRSRFQTASIPDDIALLGNGKQDYLPLRGRFPSAAVIVQ